MNYQTTYHTPVGNYTLASDGTHLVGLWREHQKHYRGTIDEEMTVRDALEIFDLTKDWLDRYFARRHPGIPELPLKPTGTAFRQEIWDILCRIPYGKTRTYGEIAKEIAERTGRTRMSGQAVGGAVGHNPISIIIPCHRVVGSDGSLTGYAGGIATKIKLLELEGVDMTKLSTPSRGTAL